MGARLGDPQAPLLVSVRSGARASMPGMMDTILNLGLNDAVAEGLAAKTQQPALRVRRLPPLHRDAREHRARRVEGALRPRARRGARAASPKPKGIDRTRLNAEELKRTRPRRRHPGRGAEGARPGVQGHREEGDRARTSRATRASSSGRPSRPSSRRGTTTAPSSTGGCTTSPTTGAPPATCRRWSSATSGDTSATGVAFTRDPSTGEKKLYGEWLPNAQGEDVVAGIRTPHAHPRRRARRGRADESLEARMPDAVPRARSHRADARDALPRHAGPGVHHPERQALHAPVPRRRSARRAPRCASPSTWRGRGSSRRRRRCCASIPAGIDQLLHPTLDPQRPEEASSRAGSSASPGAASGHIVFNADEAERRAGQGKPVILVRVETSPEDIHGMKAARGILTARGGMTSHAAVVARGMGKPCVAGVSAVAVNYESQTMTDHRLRRRRPADRDTSRSRRATSSPSTAAAATSTRAPSRR